MIAAEHARDTVDVRAGSRCSGRTCQAREARVQKASFFNSLGIHGLRHSMVAACCQTCYSPHRCGAYRLLSDISLPEARLRAVPLAVVSYIAMLLHVTSACACVHL
jgi:hypothetical protein